MRFLFLFFAAFCLGVSARANSDISLIAVGDVLLARTPAQLIAQRGAGFVFENVRPEIRAADIAFANLESPLTMQPFAEKKPVLFRGAPSHVRALSGAGFDVLSVANNHAMDCGASGFSETLRVLRTANIEACGAEYSGITVLRRKNLRVAFVAFSEFVSPLALSTQQRPLPMQESVVRDWVSRARRDADVVVASFHWGAEYSQWPTSTQKKFAHLAVQCGADVVLGHHPHVLQGFEWVARKNRRSALVAYSLGNFLFDAPRSQPRAAQSVILRCVFDKNGVKSAHAVPVQIENSRPRRANAQEARSIVARLKVLCASLGTSVQNHGLTLRLSEYSR